MTTQAKAGSRLDPDVYAAAVELIGDARNFSARQILTKLPETIRQYLKKRLSADLIQQVMSKNILPDIRTVQRMVKELRSPDTSGLWSWTEANVEDAKLVLEVLAEAIAESDGANYTLTNDDAYWIAKIWRVSPELTPHSVWSLARYYKYRKAREESTYDLDALLAKSLRPDGIALYNHLVDDDKIRLPLEGGRQDRVHA